MKRKLVRIIIHGGVAQIEEIPAGIDVEISDYDTDNGKPEVSTYEGPM